MIYVLTFNKLHYLSVGGSQNIFIIHLEKTNKVTKLKFYFWQNMYPALEN